MEWLNILDNSQKLIEQNKTDFNEFKNLKSNLERTKYFIEQKSIYLKQIENFLCKYPLKRNFKCDQLSEEHRNVGKTFYLKRLNRKAFNSFCNAIMFSKSDRFTFLAYSNRSAVFYDEKMFKESILDIDKALFFYNSYSKTSQFQDMFDVVYKLFNRKKLCCIHSNQSEELNKLKIFIKQELNVDFSKENIQTKLDDLLREIDQLIKINSKIENKNERESISEASISEANELPINDCVDIKFSKEKGRHCIANRDIQAGEYLFIEKAYCAILLPEFSNVFCQNCFKKVKDFHHDDYYYNYLNVEFCLNCNDVVFCSNECKRVSLEYHILECGLISDVFHNIGISHLAYKIVANSDGYILNEYKNKQNVNDLMKIDYRNESKLKNVNYEQVFSLKTHENDTHVADLFKYTLTSIMLGSFYIKLKPNQYDLVFISSLILRHLLQTICNAHAITDLKDDLEYKHQTYSREQIKFATAIYPQVSLLNHSCDPNVISSFKENSSTIVVRASRNIKKNDEIFNCYGPHYLKMSLPERKQSLFEQYYFDCLCNACTNQSKYSNLKCLKCNSSSTKIIENMRLICNNCSKVTPIEEYVLFFNKIFYQLNQLEVNDYNMIIQLATKYKSCLFISKLDELDQKINLDENFKIFYLEYSKILDRLSRLNCDLNNFRQGAFFCEKSVKILESIYGDNNIEIAHELFKLAEIQCNFQDFNSALKNVDKAISIALKLYSTENKTLREFKELKTNILNVNSY